MTGAWLNKTFRTATEAFRNCRKRFPVTVCFIFMLTAFLIGLASGSIKQNPLASTCGYYLSVGTLLSLALHLWCEEMKRPWHQILTQLAGHALLLADAAFLYPVFGSNNFQIGVAIAHAAGIFAIGASMFFLPFLREKTDMASWHFSIQSLNSLASAFFTGWFMWGGISLLLASLHALFGIHIKSEYYLYVAILANAWLAPMLFIGLLPQGKDKHNRQATPQKVLNGILHYLLLPLTAAYLVVLYAYALRILAHWTLPNGWVSWLVTAIMGMCLLIEFGLYPSRIGEQKKWDLLVTRWLPLLILPLLLLMTIGIIRRFNDYGVTINRLYLITLNGWFYLVCIGLFINRAKRLNWIPISFTLALLLTSTLPVNYASYTREKIRSQVEALVKDTYKGKLPMSNEAYSQWINQMPYEQAVRTSSQLRYLENWFGYGSYAGILEKDVNVYERPAKSKTGIRSMQYDCHISGMDIPAGYSKLYVISYERLVFPLSDLKSSFPFRIDINEGEVKEVIRLDVQTLETIERTNPATPAEFECQSGKGKFLLTYFYLNENSGNPKEITLSISGYLFKKK